MADGYVLIRSSTLAYLLEVLRADEDRPALPDDVALDLRESLPTVDAPAPEAERLAGLGPVLTVEEHVTLLRDQLDLPEERGARKFWETVVEIVHSMKANEAEAVLRIVERSG